MKHTPWPCFALLPQGFSHTYLGDVDIVLTSPQGTTGRVLYQCNEGSSSDLQGGCGQSRPALCTLVLSLGSVIENVHAAAPTCRMGASLAWLGRVELECGLSWLGRVWLELLQYLFMLALALSLSF